MDEKIVELLGQQPEKGCINSELFYVLDHYYQKNTQRKKSVRTWRGTSSSAKGSRQ